MQIYSGIVLMHLLAYTLNIFERKSSSCIIIFLYIDLLGPLT